VQPRGLASLAAATLLFLPGCLIVLDDDNDDVPRDRSAAIVTDRCPGGNTLVQDAEVVGDALVVTAGHGGCHAAPIWACWDGLFLESFPVQARIAIHHAEAGDCDAYFERTIQVRLDPVLDDYRDAYGGADPLILRVGDFAPVWEP
jgi:hypothetical protein